MHRSGDQDQKESAAINIDRWLPHAERDLKTRIRHQSTSICNNNRPYAMRIYFLYQPPLFFADGWHGRTTTEEKRAFAATFCLFRLLLCTTITFLCLWHVLPRGRVIDSSTLACYLHHNLHHKSWRGTRDLGTCVLCCN